MINRDSLWYANGKHSQNKFIAIKDLDDGHLINIIHLLSTRYIEWTNIIELSELIQIATVMFDEVKLRGIETMLYSGKIIPYISHTTGELITNGEI